MTMASNNTIGRECATSASLETAASHPNLSGEASRSLLSYGIELFFVSFLALYLEVLVIRWLPGEIRFFTVFKTFPLIACFVGLGLGFILRRSKLFALTPMALLTLISLIASFNAFGIMRRPFPSTGIYAWQSYYTVEWAELFACAPLILLMLGGAFFVMVCMGTRLGSLFERFRPLSAYSIDVAGAIAGSGTFALLSLLDWPPWLLLVPAVLLLAAALWGYLKGRRPRTVSLAALALSVLIAFWVSTHEKGVQSLWSPYQQLTVMPLVAFAPDRWTDDPAVPRAIGRSATQHKFIDRSYVVFSNHWFYQYVLDLSDKNRPPLAPDEAKSEQSVPGTSQGEEVRAWYENRRHYDLPYKLMSAKNVLIVGSGTGNDVAAALRNGVAHIDAVDIDPVLLSLGKRLHPERPYQFRQVSVILDDARHYFSRCKKKYDLILFAGLDSHTVTGLGSSVRVDTYVHTRESIAQAAKLLSQDGLILLSFNTTFDWLKDKMFRTIREAVGYEPLILSDKTVPAVRLPWKTFVIGTPVANGFLPDQELIKPFALESHWYDPNARIVNDDWPYLYVSPQMIDIGYCLIAGIVLAVSVLAARPLFTGSGPRYWQLFFMGAAFLLLELKSIAQLSLIFGSTWWTSSAVIIGLLIMILTANLLVAKLRYRLIERQDFLYAALAIALSVNYLTPADALLNLNSSHAVLGAALATVASIFPLFIASLIFAVAFRSVNAPAIALGFNLFGAVIGGLLEYLSVFSGINSLVAAGAVLYFLSYLCLKLQLRPISTSISTAISSQ